MNILPEDKSRMAVFIVIHEGQSTRVSLLCFCDHVSPVEIPVSGIVRGCSEAYTTMADIPGQIGDEKAPFSRDLVNKLLVHKRILRIAMKEDQYGQSAICPC